MSEISQYTTSMLRGWSTTLCILLLLGLAACRQAPESVPIQDPGAASEAEAPAGLTTLEGSALEVSIETGHQAWQDEDAILIDVREPEEYAEGHIPGITLIPMGQVDARLDEIPTDRPVILSCRTGRRSLAVTEYLRDRGYDQVYSMQGGILAWEGAGHEVER